MPGKKITDQQVRKYKAMRRTATQEIAAARMGISVRSARRIEQADGPRRVFNRPATPFVARFVGSRVEKTGERNGIVHGELALHGKTRPLDLAITLNKVGNDPYTFKHTAGFSATATLRRSAFGMDKLLSAVGDEVQLDIAVEAQRGKARDNTEATPPPTTDSTNEDDDGTAQ